MKTLCKAALAAALLSITTAAMAQGVTSDISVPFGDSGTVSVKTALPASDNNSVVNASQTAINSAAVTVDTSAKITGTDSGMSVGGSGSVLTSVSISAIGAAWRVHMGNVFPAMALVAVSALVEPVAVVEIQAHAILPL